MTVSVLQEVSNEDPNFGTTGLTIAVTGTFAAGNTLHAFVTFGGNPSVSVADDVNGTWGAALDNVFDSGNGQSMAQFRVANPGAGSRTVTATFGVTSLVKGIWVLEIGGASASPLDGHTGQSQSAPTTGVDATTSGTQSNATQPALIVGISMDMSGSSLKPAAGTGFTSTKTAFGFPSGSGDLARSENKRITTTTAVAATFTAAGNTGHTTLMSIYDELSGAVSTQRLTLLRAG